MRHAVFTSILIAIGGGCGEAEESGPVDAEVAGVSGALSASDSVPRTFAGRAVGDEVHVRVEFGSCWTWITHDVRLKKRGDQAWEAWAKKRDRDLNGVWHDAGETHFRIDAGEITRCQRELERARRGHDPDGGFLNHGKVFYFDWDADGTTDEEVFLFDPGRRGVPDTELGLWLAGVR